MSAWSEKFNDLTESCKEATLTQAPLMPLACLDPDLTCKSSRVVCSPGEFCRLKDATRHNGPIKYTFKTGTCDRCTESKRQSKNNHPGASEKFDFQKKNYGGGPLDVADRCTPFVNDYVNGNAVTHAGSDQSFQKHGGYYVCKQDDECEGSGCQETEDAFGEVVRLNTLACPKSNPFAGNGLKLNLVDTQLGKSVDAEATQAAVDRSYVPAMVILDFAA